MRHVAVLVALAAACLSLGSTLSAGAASTQPSFAFGRTGGNIQPFTVVIARDGSVKATGPVETARKLLTAKTMARLAALAATEHFFSLRQQISCPGSLPDFAFRSITVSPAPGKTRTVLVRGGCRPGFNTLYTALAAAAGVRT